MTTVAHFLATRLSQLNIHHHFVVPGDYTTPLLDSLRHHTDLTEITCTNELNCAFAADGYARARGLAACLVTYGVGALSAFTGIAGAYAENLPVLLISGAPNTNDREALHSVHHSLDDGDLGFQVDMVRRITCVAVVVRRAADAPRLIDWAVKSARLQRKPAYIEIPVNLAHEPCALTGPPSAVLERRRSDALGLEAAARKAVEVLRWQDTVTMLVGPKVRAAGAESAVVALAETLGCAVTVQPAAKSMFPESHPQFAGVYWGEASTLGAEETVEWSDVVVCVGTVFTDYSTAGWTAMPPVMNRISVGMDQVTVPGGEWNDVLMKDFLGQLAAKLPSPKSVVEYKQRGSDRIEPLRAHGGSALTRKEIARQIENILTADSTLFVDIGDSWFDAIQMGLARGARVELQMQWAHSGWSIPAAFGYALGDPDRKVAILVGDGAFQMTAQEVSQMTRYQMPVSLFVVNNRGYTVDVEIGDGIVNNIKNWDYTMFLDALNSDDGYGRGYKVTTAGQLQQAIEQGRVNRRGPTLIECSVDRADCSRELVVWGHLLGEANKRQPAVF
ncbi:alpha-keto acid decarboxylase family protein [Aspergillus ibericus CBS 121593]|uniref:Pyruvate decarboxylase n=1 Tax=Aspergillus ibericus CBS 121593 TaxID=1448316 RepID=A0A395GPE9_9EURO|nr:putative pyruvate decarboxylase C186.09 [Aspergillus ibericus CBS 121593]RAK95903.1 putative pyruvate decarboxylase C186.09 [Aspergillus ibericus CBS 121593]